MRALANTPAWRLRRVEVRNSAQRHATAPSNPPRRAEAGERPFRPGPNHQSGDAERAREPPGRGRVGGRAAPVSERSAERLPRALRR